MQVGTFGITLQLQTDEDLTGAQSFTLKILRPNGTSSVRTLGPEVIGSPPNSGIINYTTQQSDFTVDGTYWLELTDTTAGRQIGMSPIAIYIEPNV